MVSMVTKKLVQIRSFNVIGKDTRGLTAEFFLSRQQDKFVFVSRKEGSLSGNTYHEGKNPATKPKIFILLTGKIILSYRKIGTDQKYSQEIEAPTIIEISPQVTHKVEALNDFVLLECNSLKDIQNDRIKEEV